MQPPLCLDLLPFTVNAYSPQDTLLVGAAIMNSALQRQINASTNIYLFHISGPWDKLLTMPSNGRYDPAPAQKTPAVILLNEPFLGDF